MGPSRTDPSQMGVSDGPVRDMPVQSQGCLQHSVDLLSRYVLSALPQWIMCAARRVLLGVSVIIFQKTCNPPVNDKMQTTTC